MPQLEYINLSGDRFGNKVARRELLRKASFSRFYDSIVNIVENIDNYSQVEIQKLIFERGVPFYVAERFATKLSPIKVFRCIVPSFSEGLHTADELNYARFLQRPESEKNLVSLQRCNLAEQPIFYVATSGLVALTETTQSFINGPERETVVVTTMWKIQKNLVLAVIGDIDRMERSSELISLKNSFYASEYTDEEKRNLIEWLRFLDGMFTLKDPKYYKFTAAISAFFYSIREIDGILYPSIAFRDLQGQNTKINWQDGYNYAILPSAFQSGINLKLELCVLRRLFKQFGYIHNSFISCSKIVDDSKNMVLIDRDEALAQERIKQFITE